MNIAFIHEWFPGGGAANVTLDIIRYLSRFPEHKCVIYCADNITEELMDDKLRATVTVKKIARTRNVLVKGYNAYRMIKKDKIDILVQVSFKLRDISLLKRLTGVQVVLANHGNTFWHHDIINEYLKRNPEIYQKESERLKITDRSKLAFVLTKERFKTWYDQCDAYTVLCNDYKVDFETELGIEPSNSHVYAIENAQEAVPDVNYEKEKIILYCGRLSEEKRVDHLLEIWSKVQDRIPDYQLIIVGGGRDEEELKKKSVDLGLERISFTGQVSNPDSYYRRASITCLTSRREGWPLVLTEAQAHGCIPVAYNCTAGISNILSSDSDGICGFKIKNGDIDAFAEKLVEITSMSAEKKLRIRKNAVRKRLRYIPDIQYKKWLDLFEKLVASK